MSAESDRPLSERLDVIGADEIHALVDMPAAIDALDRYLASDVEANTPARTHTRVQSGHFLIMPAELDQYAGVKVATVAPDNSAVGLPRIQGSYLLFDAGTLRPLALLDGVVLTAIRTPALSAVAAKYLSSPDASRLTVFGTGIQAQGHVSAIAAVRPITTIRIVSRRPERGVAFAEWCAREGFDVDLATPQDAVREADIIACCTDADKPLFDGRDVPAHALVVAVGSHEPTARELDDRLLRRSSIYVEDVATASREAGEIVQALARGSVVQSQLVEIRSVVQQGPGAGAFDAPRVFKSVGMAWEDLVVAGEAYRRHITARD